MHAKNNSSLVFIDTEFSPVSRQCLSFGAIAGLSAFYAETADAALLKLAREEFRYSDLEDLGSEVCSQLGATGLGPLVIHALGRAGKEFFDWVQERIGPGRVDICYDYSHDAALLEQALAASDLTWPENWCPCNLSILNNDPSGDAARKLVWSDYQRRAGVGRHHALADAAALQAAYLAQSAPIA